MEALTMNSHTPAIPIQKNVWKDGWHPCNICYKKRLECSLATLTYRIPSIRNISRTIRYCKDDEECTFQALARQNPRRRI